LGIAGREAAFVIRAHETLFCSFFASFVLY